MISSLSFVFPMYNEIDNLERTVREATQVGRRITSTDSPIAAPDAVFARCCTRVGAPMASAKSARANGRDWDRESNVACGRPAGCTNRQ